MLCILLVWSVVVNPLQPEPQGKEDADSPRRRMIFPTPYIQGKTTAITKPLGRMIHNFMAEQEPELSS